MSIHRPFSRGNAGLPSGRLIVHLAGTHTSASSSDRGSSHRPSRRPPCAGFMISSSHASCPQAVEPAALSRFSAAPPRSAPAGREALSLVAVEVGEDESRNKGGPGRHKRLLLLRSRHNKWCPSDPPYSRLLPTVFDLQLRRHHASAHAPFLPRHRRRRRPLGSAECRCCRVQPFCLRKGRPRPPGRPEER